MSAEDKLRTTQTTQEGRDREVWTSDVVPHADSLPVLRPIHQDTTPTLIARELRKAIATGRFAPGQQLLETALAKSLGVSRGPLREAMQQLTQEGLLINHRNRGLFVIELDEAMVRDVYLARGAVERAAVEHLIAIGRNESARELLVYVERMQEHRGDPSSSDLSSLDLEFHEKLVELADSPQLRRMHQTLLTQVQMCLTNMQATYDSIDHRVMEHRELAEEIIAGHSDQAVALLRAHMDDGLHRLLAHIEHTSSDAD